MSHYNVLVKLPHMGRVGYKKSAIERDRVMARLGHVLAGFDENEHHEFVPWASSLEEAREKFGAELAERSSNCRDRLAEIAADPGETPAQRAAWFNGQIAQYEALSKLLLEAKGPAALEAAVLEVNKKQGDYTVRRGKRTGRIRLGDHKNPRAKWDWWQLGGRWAGDLLVARGDQYRALAGEKSWVHDEGPDPYAPWNGRLPVDACAAGAADWDAQREREAMLARKRWEDAWRESPDDEVRRAWTIYGFGEKPVADDTVEKYVARSIEHPFTTYAVLDEDGEWHEPGRMGWWGISHSEQEGRDAFKAGYRAQFLDKVDPDTLLCVVDCHI